MPAIAGPTRVAWSRPTSWPITVWIRRRAWTSRPGRRGTGPLGRPGRRRQQPDAVVGQQPGSSRTPGGPVPQHPAVGVGHHVVGQDKIRQRGRGERPSASPPASRPRRWARTPSTGLRGPWSRPKVAAQPAAGSGRRGLSGRPASRSCPGSSPAGQADLAEEVLAELGVDRPQIGRLAGEGGAVHPAQGRDQSPRSGGRAHSGPCRARCPGTRRRPRWSGPGWRPGAGGGRAGGAGGRPATRRSASPPCEQRQSIHGRPRTRGDGSPQSVRGHNSPKPAHRVS
jgi:hypothetical protein